MSVFQLHTAEQTAKYMNLNKHIPKIVLNGCNHKKETH